jgi:hypothetical protein
LVETVPVVYASATIMVDIVLCTADMLVAAAASLSTFCAPLIAAAPSDAAAARRQAATDQAAATAQAAEAAQVGPATAEWPRGLQKGSAEEDLLEIAAQMLRTLLQPRVLLDAHHTARLAAVCLSGSAVTSKAAAAAFAETLRAALAVTQTPGTPGAARSAAADIADRATLGPLVAEVRAARDMLQVVAAKCALRSQVAGAHAYQLWLELLTRAGAPAEARLEAVTVLVRQSALLRTHQDRTCRAGQQSQSLMLAPLHAFGKRTLA